MCINFQCEPIIPLNEKAKSYRKILIYLLTIYLILTIIKSFYQFTDLFSLLLEMFLFIFTCLMCHYILCTILIFLTSFNLLFTAFFLGQIIQNKIFDVKDEDINSGILNVIIQCIYLIYCIVLIVYLFLAYKEFKAIFVEQMSGHLNNDFYESETNKNNNGLIFNNNEYNNYNSNTSNNNNQNKKFIPFSGKGYTVGGN